MCQYTQTKQYFACVCLVRCSRRAQNEKFCCPCCIINSLFPSLSASCLLVIATLTGLQVFTSINVLRSVPNEEIDVYNGTARGVRILWKKNNLKDTLWSIGNNVHVFSFEGETAHGYTLKWRKTIRSTLFVLAASKRSPKVLGNHLPS